MFPSLSARDPCSLYTRVHSFGFLLIYIEPKETFVYLFLDTIDSLITHLLVYSKLSSWEKERQAVTHT